MEFGLSETQLALRESVDRYLSDQSSLDRVREFADSEEGFSTDIWSGLADLGIPGMLIPEAYGGVAFDPLDAVVVAEQLGYHVAPVPFLSSAIVAPTALLLGGSDDQKNTYLPKLANGEVSFGIGLNQLCGVREGTTINVVNSNVSGRVKFVSDPGADFFLIADSNGQLGIVDSHSKGISVTAMPQVDRTRKICAIDFENTPIDLLALDANKVNKILRVAWVVIAADTLGASQSMLDKAIAYAMQREQFNRVIASFQAVKHMCAEMAAELEPARALIWYAGFALSEVEDEAFLTASHAKAHLAEVGTFVARTSTVVHGGMGFTDLLGLHYWFKRIGFNRQYLGGPEYLRGQAAKKQGLPSYYAESLTR